MSLSADTAGGAVPTDRNEIPGPENQAIIVSDSGSDL